MKLPPKNTTIQRTPIWLTPFFLVVSLLAQEAAPKTGPARHTSEEEIVRLEKFTVTTATRGAKDIAKLPGSIVVLTNVDIDRQYLVAEDLSKALAAMVPGFSAPRQKVQGLGETIRGRDILYLLDGIPQSNPLRAGLREGYFVDSSILERIEVLSGPSALHGLGATGGIVNYITKTPRAEGMQQTLSAKTTSQFEADSFRWKTNYSLSRRSGAYDVLLFTGLQQNGMSYDAKGRTIGIDNDGGDLGDTKGSDFMIKLGWSPRNQRLEMSYNRYELEGNGDYVPVAGNRAAGIPTTSRRAPLPGGLQPNRNLFESGSVVYKHYALLGGALSALTFVQKGQELFSRANAIAPAFQDARIAPLGTLADQSEIFSEKRGVKMTWIRSDFLVSGVELTAGADWMNTQTEQKLALTGRTWVPLVDYDNFAGFLQVEYERGPLVLRGGMRGEKGTLNVATYRTLAATRPPEGVLVQGGSPSFSKAIPNLGLVWRFNERLSAFLAYSEGFGLPDAGLVLRGVNAVGRSVETLIDLTPVVVSNNEVGLTYRGKMVSLSASYYRSSSDLGSVIRVNALGEGFVARIPVEVDGFEFQSELRVGKDWRFTALYSTTDGRTAVDQGMPLDLALGARNQGPDKVVLSANYAFNPKGRIGLEAVKLFDRDINIGRRSTTNTNLEEHFNGYTLLDLTASYETRFGTFAIGVENLLNKYYIGYYSQANAASQTNQNDFFAGRGRSVTLSYQLKF